MSANIQQGNMDAFVSSNKESQKTDTLAPLLPEQDYEIDEIGKTAISIKHKIENATEEELPCLLVTLSKKWGINSHKHRLELTKRNFLINKDQYTIDEIEQGYDICRLELALLNAAFLNNKLLSEEDNKDGAWMYRGLFDRLSKIIYYSEMNLRANIMVESACNPEIDQGGDDLGLFRFTKFDDTKNTPFQRLLIFLLKWVQERGYKRYRDSCCEKFYTDEGNYTHYMAPKFPIKEVPHRAVKKETNFEYWSDMTAGNNVENVSKWLQNGDEVEFQSIKKNRNVFAFSNGIYVTADRQQDGGHWVDHFYEYGKEAVDEDVFACRFFDFPFRHETFKDKGWFDIPTPNVDKILYAQGFHEEGENQEVLAWLWAYMGRCLYEAGSMDNWQTSPFFRGKAGTGKSSVVDKIIGKFYDMEDVGNLSNNTEKQFGLQNQYDKLVVIGPEVKSDFALNQAEFQQIVSAERMTIARKNNDAWIGVWTAPIALAGNEMPDWSDKAGSLQRRWVVWEFTKRVKKKDTKLQDKIMSEMDAIIKKANIAYLAAVHTVGEQDIWEHLPKYFHDQQKKVAEHTNPLYDFLSSQDVKMGADYYCRETEFKEYFNKFVQINHLKKNKWNKDFYESPFESYDITRITKCGHVADSTGKVITGTSVLRGVELVKDSESDDEYGFE